MPEQLLDRANVMLISKQMGRERVAEGVAGRAFGNAGPASGFRHRALEHGLMQVVPAPLAGRPVQVEARGGKHSLPCPLPAPGWILPLTPPCPSA